MVAFFAACTNCPLTALAFAGELFGFASLPATIVAIAPACLIARRVSLYPTSLQRARGKCQFDPAYGVVAMPVEGRFGKEMPVQPRLWHDAGLPKRGRTGICAGKSENARPELWAAGFQGAGVS